MSHQFIDAMRQLCDLATDAQEYKDECMRLSAILVGIVRANGGKVLIPNEVWSEINDHEWHSVVYSRDERGLELKEGGQ